MGAGAPGRMVLCGMHGGWVSMSCPPLTCKYLSFFTFYPPPPPVVAHVQQKLNHSSAFTQLTADNQYAPLGLVLLGALAQLHTAISPLLPAAPPLRPLPASSARRIETPASTLAPAPEPPLDLGESVSRDEFGPAAPRERGAELAPVAGVSASAPAPKRAKSAQGRPGAVRATRNKDKDRDKGKGKDKDRVKKTKKKKAAGTDFSDIFGSLT